MTVRMADAGALELTVLSSLAAVSDAALDRVTSGANVALGRRWLRLVDSLDLGPLVGETVELRYLVASRAGAPVALTPFFVAAHPTVRFVNSFEKAFFTGMEGELQRATSMTARQTRWLLRALTVYRRLLALAQVRTDGWLIAVSPMTFRGGIPTAPMAAAERARVQAAMIERLKELAAAQNLPFSLFCVPEEDQGLRETARACGLSELFLSYDMYIPLPGSSVEDYLAAIPGQRQRRGKIRREMRAHVRSGAELRPVHGWSAVAAEMTRMYETTYSQYGDHFAHPPAFWEALERHLGDRAEAVMVQKDDQWLGFTTLLHNDNGDLTVYRTGRADVDKNDGTYFDIVFYEPIRRAYALGCRRLWLGTGAFEAKRYRGALGHALYAYLWLPTRRARALLLPYVRRLTDFVAGQLQYVNRPHQDSPEPAASEGGSA